jgi:hypothetical protein
MEFLAQSKGMTVDELKDSLTPREQRSTLLRWRNLVSSLKNYTNYNDFKETQKDWSAESEESRLRNYLSLSNPDLSTREVDHLYNKKYNTEGLDEEDDEFEITERTIILKPI